MMLVDANLLISAIDTDFKRFSGLEHVNPLD